MALRVTDVERCLHFYRDVLGLSELPLAPGVTATQASWLRTGDVVLMLERTLRGRGAASGSGHVLVLAVDDLSAWEARLTRFAVTLDDRTPHTLYVRDPEGHRVGLSTYAFDVNPPA